MAVQKSAKLTHVENVSPYTRRFELEMLEGARLGFMGGQYIIVDSGLPLPGGKVAKRAYSILSCDEEQTRFELAVRRIESGPASNYMHELSVGASLHFSGPWGKLVPDTAEQDGPTVIIATDTGITAALGLVHATAFRPRVGRTTLLWLVESNDYFLPLSFVRRRVPQGCTNFQIETLPPIGHPERTFAARTHLQRQLSRGRPSRAYLVGDGSVVSSMSDALVASGLTDQQIGVECFFNNPSRKAA
jgi:ferredoxin-NADP reductase